MEHGILSSVYVMVACGGRSAAEMLAKSLQHKVDESESVHACEMQDLQRQLDRQREMAIQFSQQVCVSLPPCVHFSLASLLKNVLS